MVALYEALRRAGEPHGIADFGIYAVDSMRLDKCYRGWKNDLETGFSPIDASLDRFIAWDKPEFVGSAALLAERRRGAIRRFVPLLLEEAGDADAPACAGVFVNGERVGLVTSGGFSYTLGKSIALAYMRADQSAPGTRADVEIFGERRAAVVAQEPLYDPTNARLRG
jgi:dimethylglycine dehydrogenase